MPNDQLFILIVLLVVANVAALVIYVVPQLIGRDGQRPLTLTLPARRERVSPAAPEEPRGGDVPELVEARPGLSAQSYTRVVRIVGLLFVAAVGTIVTLTGEWPETSREIYTLLAAATVYVVVVQDLLPRQPRLSARGALDAVGAVSFVTLLVAFTDGFESPFYFGYFLIIAGSALVFSGRATGVLAAASALTYVVVLSFTSGAEVLPAHITRVAINLLALGLLSYLAVVVARDQRHSRDEALRLSRYDPLTRLSNRSYILSAIEREIRRAGRSGRRFGILMLDLDDLKPINDNYGHHYGDRVLRAVGDVIRQTVRLTDVAARYGGDEFVVLLPETDPTGAYVLAEKLRLGVLQLGIRIDERLVRTSVSIGAATYPDDGTTTDQLMISVDAAMYESKRLGKDRIVALGPRGSQPGQTGRSGRRVARDLPTRYDRQADEDRDEATGRDEAQEVAERRRSAAAEAATGTEPRSGRRLEVFGREDASQGRPSQFRIERDDPSRDPWDAGSRYREEEPRD